MNEFGGKVAAPHLHVDERDVARLADALARVLAAAG